MKRLHKSVISSQSQAGHATIKKGMLAVTWLMALLAPAIALGQVPSLTYSGYSGPQSYLVGTAITTMTPSNSGGAIIATGSVGRLAGSQYASGFIDGTGVTGLFNNANGIVADASGNFYVADGTMIRKVTSAGTVTAFAGGTIAGTTNATGTNARFNNITAICTDGTNLYVADCNNHMIRKVVISTKAVTTLAGSTTSGSTDGTGTGAKFNNPTGIAYDGSANLYVADYNNNEIRKIVISSGVVTTFSGTTTSGSADGTSAARFHNPSGMAYDGSGNLYVADYGNNMIRKIVISTATVSTLAGSTTSGNVDASGTSARFNGPYALGCYSTGNIYVADKSNNEVRMVTTSGVVTTYAGSLTTPTGIAVNSSGTVYVTIQGTKVVSYLSPRYYTISPDLPDGLTFNNTTGVISGAPGAVSAATNYTVTAYSNSGAGTVSLNLAVTGLLSPAQTSVGFVQQEAIKVSGIVEDSSIYALSNVQKQTSRVYLDGLGRTVQAIGVQASPLQNDLIQPAAYDKLGRPVASYLPYAGQSTDVMGSYRANAVTTDQPNFYNNTGQYLIAKDTAAHANNVYEAGPLQRVLKSGMVGDGFQPEDGGTQHYKTISYRYNVSGDGNIPVFNFDGTFTSGKFFPIGSLSVTDGTDEDGTETLAFTDKGGRLILKRQKLGGSNLDTYYIYNMAGMVSYVIPPRATQIMGTGFNLTTAGVPALYFHYIYDTMGRLTQKKVPTKGVMYVVYDPMNRPVLTQDSNMRAANKWAYVKYDVKGRPISSGIYVDAAHNNLSGMQSYVSGLSYSPCYEVRSSSGSATGYYTNNVFPTTGTTPLSYGYFDDYDLTQSGSDNYSYVTQGLGGEIGATTAKVKGVPTMSWKTTIGSGVTSGTWLLKVTFYDKRGNPIQTRSNNHVYYVNSTTLTDTATVVPDFVGVPQSSLVKKKSASSTVVKVQTNFYYDHMYRVKSVDQYYNGGAVKHLAAYTYNELGQVVKKGLGYVNSTTWLQNVDMRYNIRGQLLSINNSKMKNDTGKTNGDTNDIFGMEMLYDKVDANLGNAAYYNGKLSAVKWMSSDGAGGTSYERAYRYYYDALNRDTAAIYSERTATSTGSFTVTHGWDEDRITYDYNGNIKTLYRNASTQGSGTHTTIDNLAYSYSGSNNNLLTSVADASGNSAGFVGGTGGYTYDGNGNLTREPYKGISAIAYNVLNKTDKISFTVSANRYIDYTYDADGNIIRKRQYDNIGGVLTLQNTTDYLDGFMYTTQSGSQKLSYFAMPEGRVVVSGSTFTPTYTITDQQGNVRMEFDNTGTGGALKVKQENSYYAFGLIMPGSVVATPTNDNKHLYNGGSEWQNDYANMPDYYQTYYRNYDAALGRWIGADPMAESAAGMTIYQYAGNNPVMYNDPLGDLRKEQPGYVPYNPPENHLRNGAWDHAMQSQEDFFEAGAGGLYGSNPGLAWYLGQTNGTEIFHRGDPNAATPDPIRGSAANATGLLASAGVNIVDNDGKVVINAGYTGGIATYMYKNGQLVVEPNSINDDQLQLPGDGDHWIDVTNNGDWQHLRSQDVKVTFDPGADQLVTPRLSMYFKGLMNWAHSELGINSVNISSTTNHPTNKARSRHTHGLAFDINYINGQHVTNNDKSSIYGIEYDLFFGIFNTDSALNEQYLEYYSPNIQQRWVNEQNTLWPSVAPGHQNHIHISLQ